MSQYFIGSRIGFCLVALLLVDTSSPRAFAGENWPQWRGPNGNGTSDSTGLPTTWSSEENVVWKVTLPSWSGSTPVVWGDRIFVASPSSSEPKSETDEASAQRDGEDGEARDGDRRRRGRGGRGGFGRGGMSDAGGSKLLLLCLSKKDGSVQWQKELAEGNTMRMKHNSSSPSPVTDGKHVWAMTGTGMVTAFDMDGKQVWQRDIQKDYGNFNQGFGYGSSPLLHDGNLILQVLHGAGRRRSSNEAKPSYLLALDAATGKEMWKQERKTDAEAESPDAYTSPIVVNEGNKFRIIVSGADYVTGHDPKTGKEVWRSSGLNPKNARNYRIISSPVTADGMIYAPTRKSPLLALRTGGSGDVTKSHLAWKWEGKGGPDVPTPVSDGKYFYMAEDRGDVTCVDAKTGKLVWGPESTGIGTVSASPLLADSKLYITDETGETAVLAAGPKFKQLATNKLDGSFTLSSIAVSGKQLFLRTSKHLYCIGDK